MSRQEWVQSILTALLSASAAMGLVAFIGKEWVTRVLDRQAERFKHELGVDATKRELLLRSQIDFRERQLSEFYGPIYAYLKRGRPIYDLWKAGKLQELSESMRALFMHANDEIVKIILSKGHLIRGPEIPEPFTQYLTHVAVWHAYADTPHASVPFAPTEFPEAFYPPAFEREIFQTTEALKR
jgi:hypothetical protein